MIDFVTTAVANARLALDTAATAHARDLDEVNRLAARIERCNTAQTAITSRRLAGTSSDADAAEFAALAGDINTLNALLAEAQSKATASQPTQERADLARAENDLLAHRAEVIMAAAIAHTREIERAYVECLRAVWVEAQARGVRTPGDAYTIAPEIRNLVRYNSWGGLTGARQ
jgi:cob(I)alamin adenosyltransferase